MRSVSSSHIDEAINLGRQGETRHPRMRVVNQSGVPLLLVDGFPVDTQLTWSQDLQLAAKRALDIVLSLAGLVVLSPLLLVIAMAIRLDDGGPILFSQRRDGYLGRNFTLYKFRTVSPSACDRAGGTLLRDDDWRVSKLGRFLRQSHLDELPQLWNVLVGEMSLVGPRPHVPDMMVCGHRYVDVVPYYRRRLAQMKPGLTGWAQANGLCGPVEDLRHARRRIDHDIAYCQNFSLMLDMKTMLRTAWGRER